MNQTVSTGSDSETIHLDENGKRVFPCRCGATHSGDYAFEAWAHHNCFHDEPLVVIDEEIPGYLMCMGCGKTFWIEGTIPSQIEPEEP